MSVYVGFKIGKATEHKSYFSEYYCNGCGYPVSDHDSYCPECGGAFRKEDATERTCEGHRCEETDEWVCHKCGGSLAGCMFDPVRDGFVCVPNFCPNCGAKVVDE